MNILIKIISHVIFFNLVTHNLTKGEYHFEWIYYFKDLEGYNSGMEFKNIIIEGIRDATLECDKCEYGMSEEGSKQCDRCRAFTYYDPHTNKVNFSIISV